MSRPLATIHAAMLAVLAAGAVSSRVDDALIKEFSGLVVELGAGLVAAVEGISEADRAAVADELQHARLELDELAPRLAAALQSVADLEARAAQLADNLAGLTAAAAAAATAKG
jgi:hypothetical protein